MKMKLFLLIVFCLPLYLFGQNTKFQLNYQIPSRTFFSNVIELENGNFLAAVNEPDSLYISSVGKFKSKILIISKTGGILDSIFFRDTSKSFRIDYIVKTGYGFLLIGEVREDNRSYLWTATLDKQLRLIRHTFNDSLSDVLIQSHYTVNADSSVIAIAPSFVRRPSGVLVPYFTCGAKIDKLGNSVFFTRDPVVRTMFDILERKDSAGYVMCSGTWVYLDTALNYRYDAFLNKDSIIGTGNEGTFIRKTDTSYWYTGRTIPADNNASWSLFFAEIGNARIWRNITFQRSLRADTSFAGTIGKGMEMTKDKKFIYWAGTKNFDNTYHFYSRTKQSWFLLTKMDTSNRVVWAKNYGGDAYYFLYGLIATSDGGCLMYGSRYDNNNAFRTDGVIIKVDGNGVLISTTIIPMAQLNILAYPNPSNGQLSFKVPPSVFGQIDLVVFDISGKLVYQKKEAALSETFDLSHLPNGNYLYQIFQEETPLSVGKWQKISD